MKINEFEPSRDLHLNVRLAFMKQGTTLGEWCRKNGLSQQNAMSCLIGSWNGPKARQLRKRIIEAAGENKIKALLAA